MFRCAGTEAGHSDRRLRTKLWASLWNPYQVIPFAEGYGDEGEIVQIWKGHISGLIGYIKILRITPRWKKEGHGRMGHPAFSTSARRRVELREGHRSTLSCHSRISAHYATNVPGTDPPRIQPHSPTPQLPPQTLHLHVFAPHQRMPAIARAHMDSRIAIVDRSSRCLGIQTERQWSSTGRGCGDTHEFAEIAISAGVAFKRVHWENLSIGRDQLQSCEVVDQHEVQKKDQPLRSCWRAKAPTRELGDITLAIQLSSSAIFCYELSIRKARVFAVFHLKVSRSAALSSHKARVLQLSIKGSSDGDFWNSQAAQNSSNSMSCVSRKLMNCGAEILDFAKLLAKVAVGIGRLRNINTKTRSSTGKDSGGLLSVSAIYKAKILARLNSLFRHAARRARRNAYLPRTSILPLNGASLALTPPNRHAVMSAVYGTWPSTEKYHALCRSPYPISITSTSLRMAFSGAQALRASERMCIGVYDGTHARDDPALLLLGHDAASFIRSLRHPQAQAAGLWEGLCASSAPTTAVSVSEGGQYGDPLCSALYAIPTHLCLRSHVVWKGGWASALSAQPRDDERMDLGRRSQWSRGACEAEVSHTPRRFPALLARHNNLPPASREATAFAPAPCPSVCGSAGGAGGQTQAAVCALLMDLGGATSGKTALDNRCQIAVNYQ
ncbi:hypothetical protein C8J57DRAFT_1243547 [Mycena rebaudengoi]|nr:hypothetical protein C8J57DRAFT_1243547 [Mycena rebaudengoi]